MSKNNKLDKFYTNPKVTDYIVDKLFALFPSFTEKKFLEPSAGSGNFINSLKKKGITSQNIEAYDIDPYFCNEIIKNDYLTLAKDFDKNLVVIGNPPFGTKGKLALNFLNKALSEAPVVAMIFPKTFQRYLIHKQILNGAKLVYEENLESNSFLVDNKEYSVNCVFQVWTIKSYVTYANNKRILEAKETKSQDFDTFIHNNTKATEKYFDKKKYGWKFAVYRQGYYDYDLKFTKPNQLIKNRQYLFIKPKTEEAEAIFEILDFSKISRGNTAIRGFSLTDLIKEYNYIKKILNIVKQNVIVKEEYKQDQFKHKNYWTQIIKCMNLY